MNLNELMGWDGTLTHRQFSVWIAWLKEQWNSPSRSDNYLMQIACEVRRVLSRRPGRVQMKHFQIRFGKQSAKKLSTQQATAISKARWVSSMTKPVRMVKG